jgi:flavin-dependent dehydrogenase
VSERTWDAVVIGGGPAGATAATLLAERGRSVLLLEKAPGPQLKVGESLMPATYWTLERLGMLERMRASAFPRKYSVQFFSRGGRASAPFYFFETDAEESSQTWQVLRSDFDRLLLENAAEKGVEVRFGSPVEAVRFDGEGDAAHAVGVRAALDGGEARDVDARVVIDASGQRALISRSLGLKDDDPRLRHAAYWSHFRGARRDPGIDEGATLVLRTESPRNWFWFIPLPGERTSVGVVGPVEDLVGAGPGKGGDPEAVFARELGRCPALGERLAGAERLMPVRVARDYSYLSRQVGGNGWVLAGDAFGFLDPLYSSGVFLALESGAMAADSVADALDAGDLSADRLGAHGERYADGIRAIRRLVYAFYDPEFSFGRFLDRFPEQRPGIVDLLTGNVFRKPYLDTLEALDVFAAERRGAAVETAEAEARR